MLRVVLLVTIYKWNQMELIICVSTWFIFLFRLVKAVVLNFWVRELFWGGGPQMII